MPRSPWRRAFIGAMIALFLTLPSLAFAESPPLPTIEEVTRKIDDLYRASSSHSTMKMTIVTARWTRDMEMESWTVGDDKSAIVVRAPAREAGSATLRSPDGLWSYTPRADRMVRIPSAMLGDGWMGSHITNDDLMRETSWQDDFDTTLAWIEDDGQPFLEVTSLPKAGAPVVYSKVVQRLTADGFIPVRAEYFGARARVRTMTYSGVKKIGGRLVPTVFEVIPDDKPNESTRIEYLSLENDVKVDDKLFTARGLRRIAQRR